MSLIGPTFGLCAVFLFGGAMQAQSTGTTYTSETPRSISAFGAVSRVYTDYGVDGYGYTFGADYTFNKRFVSPSVETRFTHGGNSHVNESNFAGGFKVEKAFHRFRPYLNAFVGYGVIHFDFPNYTHDNSVTYDLGLGLDYSLTRAFAVKFDAQQQYWKLGTTASELEPSNLSVGIVYRLPSGFKK